MENQLTAQIAPEAPCGISFKSGEARAIAKAFLALCGSSVTERVSELRAASRTSSLAARALLQKHLIESLLARAAYSTAESGDQCGCPQIIGLAQDLVRLDKALPSPARARLRRQLACSMEGGHSLVPMFHLMRTINLQHGRGFEVEPAGLLYDTEFDMLLHRSGSVAELSCEVVSADDGRDLHRATWFSLVDGIDRDLQIWLSAHPGRYLLKMTLPNGLRAEAEDAQKVATLSVLQRRIKEMLSQELRTDQDSTAVLRLDPLLVAGAQVGDMGLLNMLRGQFGPEAQLAVTSSGAGTMVMAARAGRENDVGAAVRRRLAEATPKRFSGSKPAILAIFLEDTDRQEWRSLRDGLQLEGEARQYLTTPDATRLVAITAATRLELLGGNVPDAAADGEIRFRNQAHPAAKSTALAPAIRSSF